MEGERLTAKMPGYYRSSGLVRSLNDANAAELTRLEDRFEAVRDQFFIRTADEALERWEREFGLKLDRRADLAYRRGRVLAKLRVAGTTTIEAVQSVARSFSGAPVTVTEHPERYRFDLRLSARDAKNLAGLQAAMEEVKPAHLVCNTVLRLEAGRNAPVWVGARLSGAVKLAVWPYLAPGVTANTGIPVTAYAATGTKIKVGG